MSTLTAKFCTLIDNLHLISSNYTIWYQKTCWQLYLLNRNSHTYLWTWVSAGPFLEKVFLLARETILIECVYYHVNLLQNIKYMPSFCSGNWNDWYINQQTLKNSKPLKHPFKNPENFYENSTYHLNFLKTPLNISWMPF